MDVLGENRGTAGILLLTTANGLQMQCADAIFAGFAMTSLTNAWYISEQAGQIRPEEVILIGVVLLQILVLRYLQILPISINDLIATGLPPVGKKRRRRRRITDSPASKTLNLFQTQCGSLFTILRKLDRQDCLLRSLCILESLRTRTGVGIGDDGDGDGFRNRNTTSNNNNNNDNDSRNHPEVNSTATASERPHAQYVNQSNASWMWMDSVNFEELLPKQIKWTLTSLRKSGRERRHAEAAVDANPEAKTIPDRPTIAVFEEAVEYGARAARSGVDCDLGMDMDADADTDYSTHVDNDDMTLEHKSANANSTSGDNNSPASICERRYSLCPLSSKEILSYIHSILIAMKSL